MDFEIKRKERKALNFSLCSLTHRNARTIKLVSLRVRRIGSAFFNCASDVCSADVVHFAKDVASLKCDFLFEFKKITSEIFLGGLMLY